jgi:threonine dehydratase
MTFAINSPRLAGALAVDEAQVKNAMLFAFQTLKLVLEPGGSVALAAVLAGRIETKGRTIAVIASGGNVDPALYSSILAAG